MTTQSPLTLYELTKQRLLNSETTASTTLHGLPSMIFHEIFMEAFMREHNEVLKVMPPGKGFPDEKGGCEDAVKSGGTCICLLSQELEVESSCIERWRLQVLDWRDVHRDFWTVGPRAMSSAHSEDASNKETGKPGLRKKKPTLRIFTHLCFQAWSSSWATHNELEFCLLTWARKRKASVHLCCEKVMIKSNDVSTILKLLRAVQLDSIQELDVFSVWGWKCMKAFLPQLKKMTNLRTFHFSSLSPEVFTLPLENKWLSCIYAFHLGELQNLRELHIHDVLFLHGTLHKIFRNQTSLEALSFSSSPLKESDLKHLAHCPSMSQLKSLSLRKFSMKSFNPETLQALLDKLASTLETLVLEHCDITDAQLLAILPPLSCCSQLKTFSCYGNHISLGILQVLLYVCGGLSQLTHGLYPAPLESYKSKIPAEFVHPEKFLRVCAKLAR
ncbi:PRAME family member 8-like, partial [Heterocephalus glaber]|uniref:PRAME family member 8-like n=1 Tax=Heterocephalus glaber TaxID=10181 RepID=A0AAX6RTL6_HETGA